jgi:hypothetical protein
MKNTFPIFPSSQPSRIKRPVSFKVLDEDRAEVTTIVRKTLKAKGYKLNEKRQTKNKERKV